MEEELREIEKNDGLRMTWNVLPITHSEDITLPLPIAALYTPNQSCELLEYEPVFCTNCRSIFNPYTNIEYESKRWICIFCKKNNHLPPQYNDINPDCLPTELIHSTVEYMLTRESNFGPIFFFIVDTCAFDDERFKLLIDGIRITYNGLPDDSIISLITYGTNINIIDFRSQINRSFVFSGLKDYNKKNIESYFKDDKSCMNYQSFFITKGSLNVDTFLQYIQLDSFSDSKGFRQTRATGAAISFAVSLLETQSNEIAMKMFLFTEGPITSGPGKIITTDLKENLRSASEIINGKSNYTSEAKKFFDILAHRMVVANISIDIICATLIDIGLYEMQSMINMTGGLVVMAQDLDYNIFTTSCEKNVKSNNGIMDMVFNARFKIQTKFCKFKNGLGIGSPLIDQNNKQIGWKLGCMHKNSNLGFVFEHEQNRAEGDVAYFQIITQFQRSDRKLITRVTTAARAYGKFSIFKQGFDQEAAIVYQARNVTFGTILEDDRDIVRRIDRTFIRFIKRYSESRGTLKLPISMSLFPNLTFFLRRSLIVQSQTNSPDETFYYRFIVGRETVSNAMTLIHPTLTAFSYQEDPKPVPMDAKSLQPDLILLLDTFHNVLIWRGEHIHQWIEEGYHEKDEYKFLKDCIDDAKASAAELIKDRLPTPQYTVTERRGSQERILLAKINPSIKGNVVVSDNIDFDTFYDSVCKILKNE